MSIETIVKTGLVLCLLTWVVSLVFVQEHTGDVVRLNEIVEWQDEKINRLLNIIEAEQDITFMEDIRENN